jgi:hypothetical protein
MSVISFHSLDDLSHNNIYDYIKMLSLSTCIDSGCWLGYIKMLSLSTCIDSGCWLGYIKMLSLSTCIDSGCWLGYIKMLSLSTWIDSGCWLLYVCSLIFSYLYRYLSSFLCFVISPLHWETWARSTDFPISCLLFGIGKTEVAPFSSEVLHWVEYLVMFPKRSLENILFLLCFLFVYWETFFEILSCLRCCSSIEATVLKLHVLWHRVVYLDVCLLRYLPGMLRQ